MNKHMIMPLIFGIGGIAILVSLGVWQLQRLAWKEAILSDINARVSAAPVAVPQTPSAQSDLYLPVELQGDFTGEELHVLASVKRRGAGYRVISVLQSDDRRIMVDRGFIPTERKDEPRQAQAVTVQGNLHWPDELDSFTPEPDQTRDIWFARDVPAMAQALDAEPFLIVARSVSETQPAIDPLPINTNAIPNDHLQYAITWFSLALLWFAMTVYLLWRIRQRTL